MNRPKPGKPAPSEPVERVLIQDVMPYETPDRLGDLQGPAEGQITLPHHVYWGPRAECDLGQPEGVIKAYQAVLRVGTAAEEGISQRRSFARYLASADAPSEMQKAMGGQVPSANPGR